MAPPDRRGLSPDPPRVIRGRLTLRVCGLAGCRGRGPSLMRSVGCCQSVAANRAGRSAVSPPLAYSETSTVDLERPAIGAGEVAVTGVSLR